MPPPLARQASEGCRAGSQCDRRVPQAIVYHSSSLSLPTPLPVHPCFGFPTLQAAYRRDFSGLYSQPIPLLAASGSSIELDGQAAPDRSPSMARSMASISTWVSMNLIRARSAFSRSKGAARVLAKASRSSTIRSRAFINVSSRSLISAPLSVGRVILIGAKRNWHKTHDDRIGGSDAAGGRLSPARDEPLGPDDGAINQRRYHRENRHHRHDNIKPEYLAAVLNEVAKADAGRLKLAADGANQRQTRIDLERRDHRGNAAGQNDLGQDLCLAGAKCPCELDLVDFNTLEAL